MTFHSVRDKYTWTQCSKCHRVLNHQDVYPLGTGPDTSTYICKDCFSELVPDTSIRTLGTLGARIIYQIRKELEKLKLDLEVDLESETINIKKLKGSRLT